MARTYKYKTTLERLLILCLLLYVCGRELLKSEGYDGAGDGGVGSDSNKQFHVLFLYHDNIVNDQKYISLTHFLLHKIQLINLLLC